MATAKQPDGTGIEGFVELTDEEWDELVDQTARRYLNMSRAEFIEAWHRGEFKGREDRFPVNRVLFLLPPSEMPAPSGRK